MQTSLNQVAKQREHELLLAIHANSRSPGMREMAELAKLKATEAHTNYIRSGPSERLHSQEKTWLTVLSVIENGPLNKPEVKVEESSNGN